MRIHICKELNARRIYRLIKHENAIYLHGHLVKEETHRPRVLAIQDWVLQESCHRREIRAQYFSRAAHQVACPPIFPPSPWNGKAVCLAKDQVTREARTMTTKRYVTLDSLFFSYSLEIEEAFHQ
jgi:hypothetical protein